MRSIQEAGLRDLTWRQKPGGFGVDVYELQAGDELLGTIHFNTLFTPSATVETAAGNWTFEHEELLGYRIRALLTDTKQEIAFCSRSFTIRNAFQATIHLREGQAVQCIDRGTWANVWEFIDARSKPLFRIKDGVEVAAVVEITELGAASPHVPLLVFFGWYLRLSYRPRHRKHGKE